ncbi:type II secretion system F family protein [Parasphingopyxis algicola]|uniref:type II secretion system F family protein n=1 Tax=Parasphingopyxis algicola TaxID=2026624 RepID=UPI0015A45610|nr:type II secretion system F family protein [Parasphingopyxis algicola]QLC24508.1 type II secretion system F family protein [Parasphingopyxis algicola]
MSILPMIIFSAGMLGFLLLLYFAFAGPNVQKVQAKRLNAVRQRHAPAASPISAEAQMNRILAKGDTRMDSFAGRFIPRPEMLRTRLSQTGTSWTLGQYMMGILTIAIVVGVLLYLQGLPLLLGLLLGTFAGLALPHMVVGFLIKRRVNKFNAKFPDAIELLVRGLRSGLPISETLSVVASEVPDPVGTEFAAVVDKMKIGKTMDEALETTAKRLGTPEFNFFCITLAIQRETGGNLAETLSNLANVLRQRSQMKLKIKAMSAESKASAYIVGSLPFIVFGLIMMINPDYMGSFFVDERLIIAGLGGLVWMGIGVFIMAKMVSFEI